MAISCSCFMSILISLWVFLGILRFSSSLIGCSWIAPLTPDVIVMRGLTFHPDALIAWMSGLYFALFFPFVQYLEICHGSM